VIRFGAIVSVVAVAIGLLIGGAVSGELTLVYVSIGLAGLALLMLIVGVAVWRDEVFGSAAAGGSPRASRRTVAAESPGDGSEIPASRTQEPLVAAASVSPRARAREPEPAVAGRPVKGAETEIKIDNK